MTPAGAALLTSLIVIAGRWSQKKGIKISIVAGLGIYAIFLTVISNSSPRFGKALGYLGIVTAMFLPPPDGGDPYALAIWKGIGFSKP